MSTAASAQTVVRFMSAFDPNDTPLFEGIASRFEAANPGTDVQLVTVAHDVFNEQFASMVAANNIPDILGYDSPFMANYVWSGYLRPIEGLVSQGLIDDLTPSGKAQGTYPLDGKQYGIGIYDSTVALYANRAYLEKVGARIPTSVEDSWTKAEFEEIMAKLAEVEGVQWPIDLFRAYGIKSEWATYAFEPLLVSAGCDLIDRKTWKSAGTLDGPACVDALTTMQNWVKNDWVVPATAGSNQFFVEGTQPAALAWGGNWIYNQASPTLGDNLVVLPLPNFSNGTKAPNGTWVTSVTAASKNPELAGKFIEFMLTDDDYRARGVRQGDFPGAKSFAALTPLWGEGGAMHIAFQQANVAVPRPQHPAYPTITNAFMDALDRILNGEDVAATLARAAKTIDEDIADNGGYPPFGG
jgi:multiple sugar transport system substrate-binding protein